MFSRHRGSNHITWRTILNPDFIRRIDFVERRKALLKDRSKPPQTEREHHYNILTWGVMPLTLEILDRAAAAFAIEPRFPFWDKRLVEFCLALPPEQKIYRGWTRMVLRRAMDSILPNEVQWRSGKSNLAPSFDHGLFVYERKRLDEVIVRNPGTIEKYVDIATLRELHSKFTSSRIMEDVVTLWKAVSLAVWLQRSDLES
jgi:asparagine synthase (glutamine-hydrolysing)